MKFAKPSYDAKERLYTCDVSDGFRFSCRRESGAFLNVLEECINSDDRIAHLVKATQGWFSKPLTEEFLKGKIRYDIPTGDVPDTFEGLVEWQIVRLIISKEQFVFVCAIVNLSEDEKVSLEFPEDLPIEETIPLTSNEVLGIGPTRRVLEKEKVMTARTKAARALFHAERLTQEYYESFGNTDWEDEVD